jgi:hypothetical protein
MHLSLAATDSEDRDYRLCRCFDLIFIDGLHIAEQVMLTLDIACTDFTSFFKR